MIGKMLVSMDQQTFLVMLMMYAIVLTKAGENDEPAVVNDSDAGKDEPLQNETVYECLGPSKEDMKLYGKLAWWMDGVIQVSLFN